MSAAPKNPFAPSTKFHAISAPSASSRKVTLPALPELHDPAFLDKLLPPQSQGSATGGSKEPKLSNSFLDALEETAALTRTTNGAAAFSTTGSACLDVFSGLNAETSSASYDRLLSRAWSEDPLTTVRLIFHLRSIHDGHALREPFYGAFAWLYHNHPRIAILNLEALVAPLVERASRKGAAKKKSAAEDDWMLADKDEDQQEDTRPDVLFLTHGYFKDLLNILLLETNGELRPESSFASLHVERQPRTRQDKPTTKRPTRDTDSWAAEPGAIDDWDGAIDDWDSNWQEKPSEPARPTQEVAPGGETPVESDAKRAKVVYATDQQAIDQARDKRRELQQKRAQNVDSRLGRGAAYKALYIAVARIFAKALSADIETLRKIADEKTDAGERLRLGFTLSLAAKWAPSVGASHDKQTNISTAIAELLYASGSFTVTEPALSRPVTQEEAHRIRGMYTRWVLSPLRRFLQIPEVLMSAGRWKAIRYNHVPSICMNNNADIFHKRDEKRFSEYLLEVAQGKKTISGATMLPHELLLEAAGPIMDHKRQVVEAQWNSMIDALKAAGTLDNCLAVCDVSGSMGSFAFAAETTGLKGPRTFEQAKSLRKRAGRTEHVPPLAPALALSMVVAHTASSVWRGKFITFSAKPRLVALDMEQGIAKQAREMTQADWGMNTNFSAVFIDLILAAAVKNMLRKDEMIKRLFVFSDMEFDASRGRYSSDWQTEHAFIKQQFEAAGFDMPEIVYWNLQGEGVKHPVRKDEPGAALVTGWSPNLLKLFMAGADLAPEPAEDEVLITEDEDGAMLVDRPAREKLPMDPMSVMQRALGKPSFATLRLV